MRRFIGVGCLMTVMIGHASADDADLSGVGGLFGHRRTDPTTGSSSKAYRRDAEAALPLAKLIPQAQSNVLSIVRSPTLYRRLPTQAITAERDMFLFLTRNPEVLVGLWDLMGITNVQIERTGPYQLKATDGSGTTCTIDLVYGDPHLHLFVASGTYDGKLVARPVDGRGVFLIRSNYARSATGDTTVSGTLDCFLQLESLGADLIARTFGGLIGRSADHNFRETAGFISQVSQASRVNPDAMMDVARRLPQVTRPTRVRFADMIDHAAKRR